MLVAGGFDGDENPLASAELYDPVADVWTPTGSMPGRRVLVSGGFVLGRSLPSAERSTP